ncbi:MAG: ABC transporter ATP-binding protein [Chitinophagaceae bacterium]|nr:MAG: ABC transporter ATP-binding protein [Chitinophagaceae bacterium]
MLPLLSVSDLSIDFGSGNRLTHALKGVSFSISRGEILALVGESGSGKSVTSLSILQLLPSHLVSYPSGTILFSEDGISRQDLLHLDEEKMMEVRGNKISMIFQEPMTSLNPVFTCGDQVMEAIRSHKKIPADRAKEKTIAWFEKVQLPDPAAVFKKYPHQLSGGQKQRVMIAMAMCCEPALLICDEPTTALDVTVQKNILRIIRELQQETGMAVIFITHDLGVVAEIADRTVVMYKGSIVEQQTTAHVFSQPTHAYTRGLLACRPVLHQKGFRLPVVNDYLQTDTTPVMQPLPANRISGDVLLKVEKLSVSFPVKRNLFGTATAFTRAVDDVSFEVYQNETVGLVGESGCGKTTLGRTLLRLVEPSSGTISYKGKDYNSFSKKELAALRTEIQIIFQDPYSSLNPRLTIGNAIAEPIRYHKLVQGEERIRQRVAELLGKVGLDASVTNRYPHEFSGGQRQRIVIARALAMNPSFIVCDESVSALDVSVQAQVLNLLNDLRAEFGFTIIFISHDLAVVRYISDRIMVMQKGKIVETGTADQVYFNPVSPYTRQLIASIPKGIVQP